MNNLILGVLVFGAILFTGCKACNGPAGDPVPDPNDTTVQDTTRDTVNPGDTVVIIKK